MPQTIGRDELVTMIHAAVETIHANHKLLSKLDSAIGDGDHGTAMTKAMDAAEKALLDAPAKDIKTLLHDVAWGVMCIDGGSTGPLFGSFFMGMSDAAGDAARLDCGQLAAMFEAGLAGVRKQTKAEVGDKTMIDALAPAVDALRAAADASADTAGALKQAAEAAATGAQATANMQARFGRARNLGERTIGHVDPGATSIRLIFEAFAGALAGKETHR